MASDTFYSGWKNYETWCVSLWLDYDQGSYNDCREQAQSAWDDATPGQYDWQTREQQATYALAESLKDTVEESNPLNDSASLFSDLLSAALSEVDWQEIAEHYLDDVDKSVSFDTPQDECSECGSGSYSCTVQGHLSKITCTTCGAVWTEPTTWDDVHDNVVAEDD